MSLTTTKEQILAEIRRIAKADGGTAPGQNKFSTETGIKKHEWYGRHWVRWGDALIEAGFAPNTMTTAYSQERLIEKFISLIRQLGRFPVDGDLRMKARNDVDFPSPATFHRITPARAWRFKIAEYCREREGYEDILLLCGSVSSDELSAPDSLAPSYKVGYVYLVKHGSRREYKIGKTFNTLRREGEIGLELPEKIEPVFYIKTDDPSGVENYWHKRFATKRKEGEWFALTAEDLRAFKRWRRIY